MLLGQMVRDGVKENKTDPGHSCSQSQVGEGFICIMRSATLALSAASCISNDSSSDCTFTFMARSLSSTALTFKTACSFAVLSLAISAWSDSLFYPKYSAKKRQDVSKFTL
jgi:hypothetical protein